MRLIGSLLAECATRPAGWAPARNSALASLMESRAFVPRIAEWGPPLVRAWEHASALTPRQFEFSPVVPDLLAFGSLEGRVAVMSPSSGRYLGSVCIAPGPPAAVLGLSWLRQQPWIVGQPLRKGQSRSLTATK